MVLTTQKLKLITLGKPSSSKAPDQGSGSPGPTDPAKFGNNSTLGRELKARDERLQYVIYSEYGAHAKKFGTERTAGISLHTQLVNVPAHLLLVGFRPKRLR